MDIVLGNPPIKNNIVGNKYNQWEVIEFYGRKVTYGKNKKKHLKQLYKCKCTCGTIALVTKGDLIAGKSKRCINCRLHKFKTANKNRSYDYVAGKNPNWRGTKDIPQNYFSQIKTGAKNRGINFLVNIDDLQALWEEQQGRCFYSNIPLTFKCKRRKTKTNMFGVSDNYASLDRLNPKKPYERGNIKWVWKAVNLSKAAFSHEAFLQILSLVYKHSISEIE